mgnify:CR=1 FL=1
MLDFGGMNALAAVARTGSVSTAAQILHITPSAVSQRIAKLEREAGQILLERSGRGVRLTGAGKLLVERADGMLAMMAEAEAELAAYKGSVVGNVKIAGFSSAVRGLLPTVLSQLTSTFPALHIEVFEREPKESIDELLRGNVDIAIIQDWESARLILPPEVATARLLTDIFDIAVPDGHRLADHSTVTLNDVAQDKWVMWPTGWQCHDWLTDTLRSVGARPDVAYTAGEHATQLSMVAAGFGIALIPRLGRGPLPPGVRMIGLTPAPLRTVYAGRRRSIAIRPAVRETVLALEVAARDKRSSSDPEARALPRDCIDRTESSM